MTTFQGLFQGANVPDLLRLVMKEDADNDLRLTEEVSNDPPRANRSNRRATLDIRALNVNSVGDKDTPDLGDVEPFLTHVTKDFVDNDFDSRVDIIHEAITEIELNASPGAPPEDRRFSVANHPGVKVDLDRWITEVRRVMAERDAYKQQVSHLTDIAQTAEDNLAWFHRDHTRRLAECEEDHARQLAECDDEWGRRVEELTDQTSQMAAEIMDLKNREISLHRRLMDADNTESAPGQGGAKKAERVLAVRPTREGTIDTVTSTSTTTKRSAKMPDPPMFEGSEGNIDFEDWLIRITSILQANADHWPTDSARLTYVLTPFGPPYRSLPRPQ
ncbi:uncharacterized protein CPUR_00451 [Claviceps purpurea 20.1]|uniref:Uncharacterized protein n=1 Tax=Claviceps purpurea (strain 20.1) TaxID=1111077 RepID=M1W987_CLAP2|nr:uncharacterized protein CPUR_00451 [Claviceps purpurea 20.1]